MKSSPIAISVIAAGITIVSFVVLPPATAALSSLLGVAMLAIAASDMREFIIPDVLSLPAIPAGLLATWFIAEQSVAGDVVLEHFLAALAAGGGLYLIATAYEALRGHAGLGLGDVKLLAAAGAWTGPQGVTVVLLVACLAALGFVAVQRLVAGKTIRATTAVPFGVFLAPSIWIVWTFLRLQGLSA